METENLEKKLFEDKDRDQYLDFSDYPQGHPYRIEQNKMKLGYFKCETKGAPIREIVGLRPKMYSYTFKSNNEQHPIKEKIRIKGVSRAAAKTLRHQMYSDQLREAKENYLTNRRIGSKLHQIYSICVYSFIIFYNLFNLKIIFKNSIKPTYEI